MFNRVKSEIDIKVLVDTVIPRVCEEVMRSDGNLDSGITLIDLLEAKETNLSSINFHFGKEVWNGIDADSLEDKTIPYYNYIVMKCVSDELIEDMKELSFEVFCFNTITHVKEWLSSNTDEDGKIFLYVKDFDVYREVVYDFISSELKESDYLSIPSLIELASIEAVDGIADEDKIYFETITALIPNRSVALQFIEDIRLFPLVNAKYEGSIVGRAFYNDDIFDYALRLEDGSFSLDVL